MAREWDVVGAKQILDDYKKPSENVDIGNVYYAATQLEAAYDAIKAERDEFKNKIETLERLSGADYKSIYANIYKMAPGKYGKPVDWPGNKCNCADPENLKIHEDLCEMLEAMGYNNADVCTASVGIWGAIQVCRELWKHDQPKQGG